MLVQPRAVLVHPGVPRSSPADRLTAMVAKHHRELWRFLRQLGLSEPDVDEALQEVLLVAAEKLETIDETRERAFLMGTAFRVARRARERYARRQSREAEIEADLPDHAPALEEVLDQARARRLADALLDSMPLDLRSVFVLFEVEEMTTTEIADLLDLPIGTVASRLRRARADFSARVSRLEAQRRFKEQAR